MRAFLKGQIKGAEKASIFFNEIRRTRREQIEISRESYEWGAPEFKLYPSGLKSPTMCPKDFILSYLTWGGIADLKGICRTSRGSAIHWEFQQDLLLSKKNYERPDLSNSAPRMLEKIEEVWPEVPFQDFETGFSGSLDGVMDWKGPTIIEIKSTSIPEADWKKTISDSLPKVPHIMQLGCYFYHIIKQKFYKVYPEKGLLCYYNTLFDPTLQEQEVEFPVYYDRPHELVDPDRTLREVVTDLIENGTTPCRNQLIEQWETYLQTGELNIECTYDKCSKHNGKNRVKIIKSV